MPISPTQSNVQAALRAFLLAVLPGVSGSTPAVFVGTIAGTTLTVTNILQGSIALNVPVLGAVPGTIITANGTGTGGIGSYTVSISQTLSNATTMATGVTVVAAQQNRVPETNNPYFAVMTPIRFTRLATNVDQSADTKFTGAIDGNTLTVSDVAFGQIILGATIFGTGVAANTMVVAFGTGGGGTGTYMVSPSQTVASETLSAGKKTLTEEAESVVQLDFHSPDTLAGDFAQTVSASLRDEYGTTFFASLTPPFDGVSPLYADDPRQMPFISDQSQYEWRWVLEARLQVSQTVSVPQEYADAASVTIKDVSALYPP